VAYVKAKPLAAYKAHGNHRIRARPKGKRIRAVIPHSGREKKRRKSLIARLE
jgi:hypothetical protein